MTNIIRKNKTSRLDNLPILVNNSFTYNNKIGLTGSIFSRPVINSLGIYKHYAIVYGYDENNVLWMIENNLNGVECITFDDFLNGQKRFKVEKFNNNRFLGEIMLSRAKSKSKSIYIQNEFNCEHFVNFCLTGISYSKQIEITKVIADAIFTCVELNVSIKTRNQELLDSLNNTRKILNIERSIDWQKSLEKTIEKKD
ncbi:MAG: hypothetical protein ACH34V_00050 [Flavobacterium sp.]|uniref:hypothetical protein n=1 Tax=Flavobacterium sp. TaxID=239 RepID=UPI00378E938D